MRMRLLISRALAALTLSATLAGCAVGPAYVAPATPPQAAGAFISAPTVQTAAAPIPPDWWRLYDDPVLNQLVEQALTENKDLKVAAANLANARALVLGARAQQLPSTDLSAGATYGRSSAANADAILAGQSHAPATWAYSTGFTAAYQLDLFGQVRRAIEAAKANAGAARAAEDAVRVTVAADTTAAYVQACGFAAQAEQAQRSLDAQQRSFDIARRQRDLGATSDFDLARAAAILAQAKTIVPALEGQRRNALLELTALLGKTPSQIPVEAAACAAPPRLAQVLPVGDGAALLRRRPDVREAERTLAADTARIGVAIASLYPSISLGGSIADAAGSTKGLSAPGSISYGLGPLISWTFPNILQARSQIAQAKAQAAAALAGFDAVVLQALKETEQALTTYGADLDRQAAERTAAERTDEALRLAKVRYDHGGLSLLDYLVTEIDAASTRQSVTIEDQQVALDQVAVFQALGGGWEQAPRINAPKVGG